MRAFIKKIGAFRVIWFFARTNLPLFFAVVFFSLTSGILEGFGMSMFMPLLIRAQNPSQVGQVLSGILEFLEDRGVANHTQAILLVMVALFFFRNVSRYLELYLRSVFERTFIYKVQSQVLEGVFTMQYAQYHSRFYPSGTALLTTDIAFLNQVIINLLVFITSVCTGLAMAGSALAINPWVTFFSLFFGSGVFLILRLVSRKTKVLSRDLTISTRNFANRCQEIFEHYRYLRSTQRYPLIQKKAMETAEEQRDGMIRIQSVSAAMFSLNQFLAILFLSGVIFFAVEVREQPVARVIVAIAIMYRIMGMITTALNGWQNFSGLIGSFESVRDNLRLIQESKEKSGTRVVTQFEHSIQFVDVAYATDDRKLISEINFTVKKGEFLGLLGRTGAGKSLLTQLITGLIFPTEGRVLVDGVETSQLALASWRSRIGLVPQDIGIFTGTLREAICGDMEFTAETRRKFERVVEQASLQGVIDDLPQGIETMVGKGGHLLSGGQSQRIALARELFREPDVLILDEATNALDALTQDFIARVIESVRGQMTIIMIAHRLRMVEKADHLVALEHGKISLEGGPEILEIYSQKHLDGHEEEAERRPAPRFWVGIREDITLYLPQISPQGLKVTDLSISGISFFGDEKWKLASDAKASYLGSLRIANFVFPVSVRPVRFSAGRLGGMLVDPTPELKAAIQNFIADSFVVDAKKTG